MAWIGRTGPKILKCICSDGVVMEMDEDILKKSNVVKEMLDVPKPTKDEANVIQIHSKNLRIVFNFLKLENPSQVFVKSCSCSMVEP